MANWLTAEDAIATKAGDAQWAQLIDGAITRSSGALIDGVLWQELADQLLHIIGEGGFSSLYARSLHLTRTHFDWLPLNGESDPTGLMFAQLQICLRGRDPLAALYQNRWAIQACDVGRRGARQRA